MTYTNQPYYLKKAFVSSPLQNIFGPIDLPNNLWEVFETFDTMFQETNGTTNYPPFNLIKNNNNSYVIEIAVSGFKENELEVIKDDSKLRISGNIEETKEKSDVVYLRHKLAKRSFKLEFLIGKYVNITDITLENGILLIVLDKIIPEEAKPIKLDINKKPQLLYG